MHAPLMMHWATSLDSFGIVRRREERCIRHAAMRVEMEGAGAGRQKIRETHPSVPPGERLPR